MSLINKSSRFFRFCIVSLFVVFAAQAVSAQVDQGELEKTLAPVAFINYEGPHSRIETREQIRNIGVGLGSAIKAGATQAGALNRYFVIHCVSQSNDSKIDADILGLGVDVGVDHIRNLRRIIQGYLQEAYGYNERDATVLAEYITVYNAVYRGDWDYFASRYRDLVMRNLTREKAGISIRFDEWPGRTLLLIPLGMGGLSSIDTTTISDDRVIEEMRKEDDKSVEQRKDMVDLKEREAGEAEQRAEIQREAIKEEENRIADERQQIQQEREQGTTQQQERELDRREQDLDRREQDLDRQREQAQRQEDFAEQKTTEAQKDREGIAQDQQTAIDDEARQARGVIGVKIEKPDTSLGRLIRFDPVNGDVLKTSPLETVNIRTLVFQGGKILAIAGENRGNGAIRLIEVNNSNLEMANQGNDDIHPNSLLWVEGNDLYAITINLSDGKLYLGRFDANLNIRAKSRVEVHPNASVSIQKGSLLTQRSNGEALILNPADLTESK
jgi:hypothetical protein